MNQVAFALAAMLTTLNEQPGEYRAPEGLLYAGMGMGGMGGPTLDEFQTALRAAVAAGLLVRSPGPCVAITARGREVAADIEASIASSRETRR